MFFGKYFFLITILFLSNFSIAQNNHTILTSICVQHANTYHQILGAAVFIEKLNENGEVVSIDSLYSGPSLSTQLEINQQYKIKVEKEGFHIIDTMIVPQLNSNSKKQRLGLILHPIVCFYIKGKVVDAHSFDKIETGKIIFKDLHTNLSSEVIFQNGSYAFCGIKGHHYHITTLIDGHLHQSEKIEPGLDHSFSHNEHEINLDLEIIRNYDKTFFEGDSITIHGFTFVDETTTLSSQGEREINKLIKAMKQMPHLLFSIVVQTEVFLEARFNRKLAEQRARMIEHKLNIGGISPHRYLLICDGKVDVTAPGSNKNQRICIWLRR